MDPFHYVGLMGSRDHGRTLFPVLPHHHPNNERLHQEENWPPVHTRSLDSTVASLNVDSYQTTDISSNGQTISGNFFSPHRTLPDTTTGVEPRRQPSACPTCIPPTLSPQAFVVNVNPDRYPMVPPVHHGLSQPQSTPQVLQHPSTAALKRRQDPKAWCFHCNRSFHAIKALNRHMDDIHSGKKSCSYPKCNFTYTGKRKLRAHLQNAHDKAPPPTRRRAALTQ
ncbi:hypothetical protein BGW80DRAFT_169539 [Lactifluus volemus]|nr:hypothetical protein BGW80DRAFT_169539 [Lactifluus volemus]